MPNLCVPGLCLLGSGACNIFLCVTVIASMWYCHLASSFPILTVPLQKKTVLHQINSTKMNPRILFLLGEIGRALQWMSNAVCTWSTGCHSRVHSLLLGMAVILGKCVKSVSFQNCSHIGKPGFWLDFCCWIHQRNPFQSSLITNLPGSDFFPGFSRFHIQELYLIHYSKCYDRNWKPGWFSLACQCSVPLFSVIFKLIYFS